MSRCLQQNVEKSDRVRRITSCTQAAAHLTDRDASGVAAVHHLLEEIDVALGVGGPVLGALHVEPEHAEAGAEVGGVGAGLYLATSLDVLDIVVGEVVDGVVHLYNVDIGAVRGETLKGKRNDGTNLLSGVAARIAWENVAIDIGHATVPGVVDGGRSVRIRLAEGLVHTDDGKPVAVVYHTVKVARVGALRYVHTIKSGHSAHKSHAQKSCNR